MRSYALQAKKRDTERVKSWKDIRKAFLKEILQIIPKSKDFPLSMQRQSKYVPVAYT